MADNTLLLSDILKSTHQFSFFHELVNLKQLENTTSEYLLKYDLLKIESTIADIITYLSSLLEVFNMIATADISEKHSVSWIFEGRAEIMEVVRNLDSIDDIVSQLLILLENKVVNSKNEDENLKFIKTLEKIDQISDLSLRVKKFSIVYKKRLDVSVLYDELESQVFRGIDNELDECLKQSFKVIEIRTTTPHKKVPNYNLEVLNKKLNANNTRTLKLPIFNDVDMSLYDLYLLLDERVKPLNMSLEYVPQALENFKLTARDLYPTLIDGLAVKYDALQEKLGFLNRDVQNLKIELVDLRWHEIFTFLISETIFLFKDIEEELSLNPVEKIAKTLNYKISVMDQTLAILNKATNLGLIRDSSMTQEVISECKKWKKIKQKIDNIEKETEELHHDEKLEVLGSVKKNYGGNEPLPNFIRKSQKLSEFHNNHFSSPSKVSKKKAIGASIAGSLGIRPVYIENTPESSAHSGVTMIDPKELKSLRNAGVRGKLLQEVESPDVDDLTSGLGKLKILSAKQNSYLPVPKTLLTTKSPSDVSLKTLIHYHKEIKSKIPIPLQKKPPVVAAANLSFKIPAPVSRPPSSLSGSSMIPRPISRSTSRLTTRSSSRTSNRSSYDSNDSHNSFQQLPTRTSSNSSRLSLGNITNITNNAAACSTPMRDPKRSSLLPTPVKGAPRRPVSSLSNSTYAYRRPSLSSDGCF